MTRISLHRAARPFVEQVPKKILSVAAKNAVEHKSPGFFTERYSLVHEDVRRRHGFSPGRRSVVAYQAPEDYLQPPAYSKDDVGLTIDPSWSVPTGALPLCQSLEDGTVALSWRLASVFWDNLDPSFDSFDVPLASMTQDRILSLSQPDLIEIMTALDSCEIMYRKYGFIYQDWAWKERKVRGDTALLGLLLQRGESAAFGHALAAHLSPACTKASSRFPQKVMQDLCELSAGAPLINDDGALWILQYAVENYMRRPKDPDFGNRPFATKTYFLDAAGTVMKTYLGSLGLENSKDAFMQDAVGMLGMIKNDGLDHEAEYGLAMGVFLGACFKLSKEMNEGDRQRKDFWIGLSDGFWSIVTTGVSAACPAAGLAPAAIGAIIHAVLGACIGERDYKEGINKLRAMIMTEQMDDDEAPFHMSDATVSDMRLFLKSQNMRNMMEIAINANGF